MKRIVSCGCCGVGFISLFSSERCVYCHSRALLNCPLSNAAVFAAVCGSRQARGSDSSQSFLAWLYYKTAVLRGETWLTRR